MAVVVLSAAGYGAFWWTHRDEGRIRAAAEEFAHAVDREDTAAALDLMCAEEARGAAESGVAEDGDGLGADAERPVETSGVEVSGDLARVRVARPSQPPATLYLRKEDGAWKLCDPERLRWPG
ncbi:hypothetical protein BJF79_19000 [Actinomadura sp. CNU-125]|uniref:Rv0361 family membrane protein n=1 Tax=Actinomadura sp. CNU-125 TaxID=1904961 RepID=UPI000961792A|nr:hypothetical protein [Actinomadura sp. CNU-125]OLT14553.1 hypothetical protein BJF79_19000 [Actinomadura sp. CNU-125]